MEAESEGADRQPAATLHSDTKATDFDRRTKSNPAQREQQVPTRHARTGTSVRRRWGGAARRAAAGALVHMCIFSFIGAFASARARQHFFKSLASGRGYRKEAP